MLIRVDCEVGLTFSEPTALVWMLYLRTDLAPRVRTFERLTVDPPVPFSEYYDVYGNRCGRALAPAGTFFMRNAAVVEDSGLPDPQEWGAYQHRVHELPDEALLYLLPSRYCEVDSELKDFAFSRFGHLPAGWSLVKAVCQFVHNHVRFDYMQARANRTALDVYRERVGVCRDFTHLADHPLPLPESPGPILPPVISATSACRRDDCPDGLQRLVRGLPRRPLALLRRPPQRPPHRPADDGLRPGRGGRGADDDVRHEYAAHVQRGDGRGVIDFRGRRLASHPPDGAGNPRKFRVSVPPA